MGNPQCEDGYTKIANELLEAMSKIRIPGEACQLLLFILRKTYGFNKKHDGIATSQIMEGTKLGRRAVERARSILRRMNMVSTVKSVGTNYLTYCINKFYKTWVSTPKKDGTVKNRYGVPSKTGTKYPPKGGIQKTKENIQKKEVNPLFWEFKKIYPNCLAFKRTQDAFQKLKVDNILWGVMSQAIVKQKESKQWKDGFIPASFKWLEEERWNDNLENSTKKPTIWDMKGT